MAHPPSAVPPQDLQASRVQGARLLDAKRPAEAEAIFQDLVRRLPQDPILWFLLGAAIDAQERFDEAIVAYRRSLALRRDLHPSLTNLTVCLQKAGRLTEALANAETAVRCHPQDPGLAHNLAFACHWLGQHGRGLQAADAGLRLDPASIPLQAQRLVHLHALGRWDEALAQARVLQGLAPAHPLLSLLLRLLARDARWEELAEALGPFLDRARSGAEKPDPLLLARLTDDPAVIVPAVAGRPFPRLGAPPVIPPATDGRITVGYLTPDLREHPVPQMLLQVLALHDRARFRILLLGTRPSESPTLLATLASHCDAVIDLAGSDDAQAATMIRAAGVQVLVDLGGVTEFWRPSLLARRPAKVQVLWLGCPGSTGSPYYDAFLADPVSAPSGIEAQFSEPLHRLAVCYHPIAAVGGPPDRTFHRRDAGLAEDAVVLLAHHLIDKVAPEQFDRWCRIAQADPRAVLWLARPGPEVQRRLLARAVGLGLPAERIVFAPFEPSRSRFLRRYELADLMLDSFPWTSHSTAGEALALGCPLVARCGRTLAARVSASVLTQAGLPELIVHDGAAFEALAIHLVRDDEARRAVQARARQAAATLAEDRNRSLARALEQAYGELLTASRPGS